MQSDHATTRSVAILIFPDHQILDATGPAGAFGSANQVLAEHGIDAAYDVRVLADHAGPIRSSSGVSLHADHSWRDTDTTFDTLVVAGGAGTEAACGDRDLVAWVGRTAPTVRRPCSVCSGAFLLAATGLLDGRKAVTHWRSCRALQRLHPAIAVEPDAIFVRDGPYRTSAGVTAGMDLALAMIEEDHGRAIALAVARELVMFLKRPGGQSQFSTHLLAQDCADGPISTVCAWALDHLDHDLRVDVLAAHAAMSPRTFARIFHHETGTTPGKFIEGARIDRARRLLEESDLSIWAVAGQCGFGNDERMRRTFHRHLNVSPEDYRRRFALQRSA